MTNSKVYFEKYFPFQDWNNGIVDDFDKLIKEILVEYENDCLLICTELNSNSGICYYVISNNDDLNAILENFMERNINGLPSDNEFLELFGTIGIN